MPNQNTNKTHCKNGHRLSDDNLVTWDLQKRNKRRCRICRNSQQRKAQENPEVKKYQLKWQRENKDKQKQYHKKWIKSNPHYFKDYYRRNLELCKARSKRFERSPKRIIYRRKWQRENPRSSTGYPLEVRIAMENVRKRDNNTCKWFGCGKTWREASIHVHHIFPKKEYPDLILEERFMICYCQEHHALWHEKRNDTYARFVRMWHRKTESITV